MNDIEWTLEPTRSPGGQHVGMDNMTIIGVHKPTGISIKLPSTGHERSQHKRRKAVEEAMQWLLLAVL
jgi:protein subunit release factor A